jgi:hypothetical protein
LKITRILGYTIATSNESRSRTTPIPACLNEPYILKGALPSILKIVFCMQALQGGRLIGTAKMRVIDISILPITISQSFPIMPLAFLMMKMLGVSPRVDIYPKKASRK